MKAYKVLLIAAIAASAGFTAGFDRNTLLSPREGPIQTGGLLDPNRFSVSHSYSMMYSSQSGGTSAMDGLYLSTLRYKFAVPVSLSLDMGFSHQPGSLLGVGPVNLQNPGGFVMPRVELEYQPFKNALIRLQYFDSKNMKSRPSFWADDFGHRDLLVTPKPRFAGEN